MAVSARARDACGGRTGRHRPAPRAYPLAAARHPTCPARQQLWQGRGLRRSMDGRLWRADARDGPRRGVRDRSEEHTSELQSLMRISYAVFCLKKKKKNTTLYNTTAISHNTQTTR